MIPVVLAAAAAWFAVSSVPRRRVAALWSNRAAVERGVRPELLAMVLAPVGGLVLVGWPWGLLVGAAAAPVVRDAVLRMESAGDRRRAEQVRRQLPGALELVAAVLGAGRPPGSALQIAADVSPAPVADDLRSVADRLAVSGDLRTALADVPSSLDVLARALRRADETGAPVAGVVVAAAADVRRDARAARREAGRRVGVRTAAPLGLCFLPAFLLIGIVPTVIALAGSITF